MLTLLAASWLPLLLALLIGIATGWWIWARPAPSVATPLPSHWEEDLAIAAPAEPEPLPEPLVTLPVQGTLPMPEPLPTFAKIDAEQDDLTLIKGVGPKIATLLHTCGVTRFAQIAEWNDADVTAIDAKLGNFAGRIVRDEWIEQCRLLAAGDIEAFSARFGELGSENADHSSS